MLEQNCPDTRALLAPQPQPGRAVTVLLAMLALSFQAAPATTLSANIRKNSVSNTYGQTIFVPSETYAARDRFDHQEASEVRTPAHSAGLYKNPLTNKRLLIAQQTPDQANKISTAGSTTENPPTASESHETSEKKSEATVLDPKKFFGLAKAGYAAAQQIPDICAKLFCYCGCDLTDCHGDLLDCFTCDHGMDCKICQDEAILALKLQKKGKSLEQIQKEIDKKFSKEYPFDSESEALKKYKASRSWADKSIDSAPTGNGKRLRKDGSCCAGKDEESKESEPPK